MNAKRRMLTLEEFKNVVLSSNIYDGELGVPGSNVKFMNVDATERFGDVYKAGFDEIDGVPVYVAVAGGDWEFPVCYMVYWNGVGLDYFVPSVGNVYNNMTNTAYGSEIVNDNIDDEDEANKMMRSSVTVTTGLDYIQADARVDIQNYIDGDLDLHDVLWMLASPGVIREDFDLHIKCNEVVCECIFSEI